MADLKVLSLGAGVQSTVLALMPMHGDLETPDCAIFADTGWEPPHVYKHLQWLCGCELQTRPDGRITAVPGMYRGGLLNYPTHIVQQGNMWDDVVAAREWRDKLSAAEAKLAAAADASDAEREALAFAVQTLTENNAHLAQPPAFLRHPDGTKGQIRRACTFEYKVRPLEAKVRELLGMEKRARHNGEMCEKWYGISLDEAQRMRDSDRPFIRNRYPLIEMEMTRQGCLVWMEKHGYPRPPKSACIGCPYHSDRHWREMRDKDPDSWESACEADHLLRSGIPGVRLPAYLHSQLVPLREVDLRTRREKGQMTLWDDDADGFDNECEGMCGL